MLSPALQRWETVPPRPPGVPEGRRCPDDSLSAKKLPASKGHGFSRAVSAENDSGLSVCVRTGGGTCCAQGG